MNRPRILQLASRALMKGADVLSTLAYLLHLPEPSQRPSEASDGKWVEIDMDDLPPVVVPPEAEVMLSKPKSRPDPPAPAPPLRGSLRARYEADTTDIPERCETMHTPAEFIARVGSPRGR